MLRLVKVLLVFNLQRLYFVYGKRINKQISKEKIPKAEG
jgi:hypothetical protein